MSAREMLKFAVICAIAQICAFATPAWSTPARNHRAVTHKVKTQSTRPQVRKRPRSRAAARLSVAKQRTLRPPSHPAPTGTRGSRRTASPVASAKTALVSSGLNLGSWAQCALPANPFSFTSLRLSSVPETDPLVPAEPVAPLAESAPPDAQIVESEPSVDSAPTAVEAPVAAVESGESPVEPATRPVEPVVDSVAPDDPALQGTAEAAVGSTLSVSSVHESELAVNTVGATSEPEPEPEIVVEVPGSDSVRFIGFVETRTRDLRVAVLRIAGRVFYGRKGEIIGGRYRLLGFTEDAARVFDLRASTTLTLAMGSP